DRISVRLTQQGNNLAVSLLRNLILVGYLVDLALFRHQHDLIAVADTGRHALRVRPHAFTTRGATLIDDVPRQTAGYDTGSRSGAGSGPASSPAATSASARRFEDCQSFHLVNSSEVIQRGADLVPIALQDRRKSLGGHRLVQILGRAERLLDLP